MIVRLSIDDKVYNEYEKKSTQAAARGVQVSPEDLMISMLDRCKALNPIDQYLMVPSAVRSKLEEVLSTPQLRDANDLLGRVRDLAALEIGKIQVHFNEVQWSRLKEYAVRNNFPVDHYVQRMVDRIVMAIFDGGLGMI